MTTSAPWNRLAQRLGGEADELTVEAAALAAWLVRSDEVVVTAEREALARLFAERLGFSATAGRSLVLSALSLDESELPPLEDVLERAAVRPAGERELLVEALLTVAASDGAVHRKELALIRRIAAAVGLAGPAFQELAARWDIAGSGGGLRLPLGTEPITVGRDADNDVQLPSLSVSRHHARFLPEAEGWVVEDLRSTNGTLVGARRVRRHRLDSRDLVQVENFCFRLDPARSELRLWNENDLLAVAVEDLCVEVADRHTGSPRRILDHVSFECYSGEVIGITGPSGSGKTTLVNALVGAAQGVRGRLRVNGQACPDLLARHARRLGLVPQDDLVHPELTVEESLYFSGALRAVPGVRGGEIRRELDRVVGDLALHRIRSARIGSPARRGISGGERKRVNLGQELLDPTIEILILDEPTTGLDPYTGLDIFRLLRRLADQGRLVLVVTHRVENDVLRLLDRILMLGCTGRVAYFGTPDALPSVFGTPSVAGMFDLLRSREHCDELANRHRHRGDPGAAPEEAPDEEPEPALARDPDPTHGLLRKARTWWRQYSLQTLRYALTKSRDRMALLVNFGQVPLIVLGCWLVLQDTLVVAPTGTSLAGAAAVPVVPGALPFVLVIAAFWLGCVSAVRELVAEQALARRERLGGQRPTAYLLSKITVLSGVTALQCVLLVAFTAPAFGLSARGLALERIFAVLLLVGLVGVTSGLCASAVFRTTEAAVAVLPALLIPQLLFGGLLVPFDEMPRAMAAFSQVMASRWGVAGFLQSGADGFTPGGSVDPARCTRFSVPERDGLCRNEFLGVLGLAARDDKQRMLPRSSFSGNLAALAGLTGGAILLAILLVGHRPREWT